MPGALVPGAIFPRDLAELKEQLRTAITSGELCLVKVPVDATENIRLVEKLTRYWREKS